MLSTLPESRPEPMARVRTHRTHTIAAAPGKRWTPGPGLPGIPMRCRGRSTQPAVTSNATAPARLTGSCIVPPMVTVEAERNMIRRAGTPARTHAIAAIGSSTAR
jgi:hypothetical protein